MSISGFKFRTLLLVISCITATSCVSQKEVSYFQSSGSSADSLSENVSKPYVARIQKGDILSVMVSSLSPEASAMFNPYQTMAAGSSKEASGSSNGYLIDEEGTIKLPLVGKLKLAGLSTTEATNLVTQSLDKYLQQPTVNIRILNFKISLLGEVAKPSVYTIPNETITLPEALSLAGDLTIYGKRTNVMVIREIEGKRVFATVDINKRDFFNSPYYYLHANDVVYVEAGSSKFAATDPATRLVPIIISGLSLVAVLISSLTR